MITVSGTTTARDKSGKLIGLNDPYAQTISAIGRIEAALKELGATLGDVVRTRVYTTDMTRWRDIAKAHRELFGRIRPASTLVEIANLIEPEMLVEIEADAMLE
jgi:enamine deaminase RidA (YjgF/YER057c/UK114 family)